MPLDILSHMQCAADYQTTMTSLQSTVQVHQADRTFQDKLCAVDSRGAQSNTTPGQR